MAITLTERAVKEVKKVLEEQKLPEGTALRLGVKGGGCSGMSYFMGFDPQVRDTDQNLQIDGLKVVVDPKSIQYLGDLEVDFNEDMLNRGFVFKNPQAKSSCGCGHSFTV